jgi:hypothetical protein
VLHLKNGLESVRLSRSSAALKGFSVANLEARGEHWPSLWALFNFEEFRMVQLDFPLAPIPGTDSEGRYQSRLSFRQLASRRGTGKQHG